MKRLAVKRSFKISFKSFKALKTEFEKLLEATFRSKFEQGSIVTGDIVRIERDGVLVDVGAKSEAFVPVKELSNMPFDDIHEVVKIGDRFEFYILREDYIKKLYV